MPNIEQERWLEFYKSRQPGQASQAPPEGSESACQDTTQFSAQIESGEPTKLVPGNEPLSSQIADSPPMLDRDPPKASSVAPTAMNASSKKPARAASQENRVLKEQKLAELSRELMQRLSAEEEGSAMTPELIAQMSRIQEMDLGSVEGLIEELDYAEELSDARAQARTKAKRLANLKRAHQSPRCAHIHANNFPCGSPAMKDETFCYFHSEARKIRETAAAQAVQMPVLDDHHGLQLAVMRVCSLLANKQIEEKAARAIFDGLRLAHTTLEGHSLACVAPKEDEE